MFSSGGIAMKNVLVLGTGISGFGAAHVLLHHGCRVVISDIHAIKNKEEEQSLLEQGADFRIGPQTPDLLKGMDTVVLSPVIPRENPVAAEALARGIPVISEIDLAQVYGKAEILAVTGTNGKTTTTSLLRDMLADSGIKCAAAGNIGASLSLAADTLGEGAVIAAEVSSFQLEFIHAFHPRAAVVLNVTPDHMERHHTMEAYAAAKARIFENMGPDDALLLNREDPWAEGMAVKARAHVYWLSTERELPEGACLSKGRLVIRLGGKEIVLCTEEELPIKGHHNVENALAASFLALQGGAHLDGIRRALLSYRSLPHRVEYVCTIDGVDYYNDSKATNTDAAVKALASFHRPVVLIAGGHDKETPLGDFMAFVKTHARHVVLLGAAAARFRKEAEKAGISSISMAVSMEDAIEKAALAAERGGVVLLSPACSSYDMYHSYEERGDDFKKRVKAMKEKKESIPQSI